MAESKGSAATTAISQNNRSDCDARETRFSDMCKDLLAVDEICYDEAMKLFKETKHLFSANGSNIGSGALEEVERFWFAFILYFTKRLSVKIAENVPEGENKFTFFRILRAAKLNIVDFFKELPQFVVKAGPILSNMYGEDWVNRLEANELHAEFVLLSLLSRSYKRAFRQLFLTSNMDVDHKLDAENAADPVSEYLRFGWLLFLALRVHALGRYKDLVTCTNGFVSILAILILHVPIRFRNFNIHDSPDFVRKGDKGGDLVASLCNMYDASEDDLRKTMEKVNDLIEDILKKKPRVASNCTAETLKNIDTEGLIYFEGLMEEPSLSSSFEILEKDYDDAVKGELDERIFINEDDILLGSESLSGEIENVIDIKRKFGSISSPMKTTLVPQSPYRSPASRANGIQGASNTRIAATPVSSAMTTAKWLRTEISPLSSKHSAELQRFLTSCDRDVTDDVTRRAHIILEAIFPSSALDNVWAEQRRLEALKLYYRVLEAMCTAEAQILHATNLTSLLTNERFHRCMLACSAELVLATHKTVTMLFPAVLERTGITAFDLSKVIESFIRHEVSLPRELRRHLNCLEERLLESMVWEKGSSLYNSLVVARPALSAEINRLGFLAEPMPSLDAIATLINFSSGCLSISSPSKKRQSSGPAGNSILGQTGDMRSPKRQCTDFRSILVERNSLTSPVKDRLQAMSKSKAPLQSAFASPNRPSPAGGGETCAEAGINIFLAKINKLAAVRINGMVDKLQVSQQTRENVYRLFQQILSQRTFLFFNRHIDQIILCCFYGVAKISQLALTFKQIIHNYRKQPQSKPEVFRSVFVDWSAVRHIEVRYQKTGQDHVDIITFYNDIFIPTVKPLLLELGPAETSTDSTVTTQSPDSKNSSAGQCPRSPKVPSFPSLPDMSPKKVSTTRNVFVSPLRTSKMDALISQNSKSLYACVGESSHAYRSPSKDLKAINSHLNGCQKARGTLDFHGVGTGLVSDAMVANSLCLQNGNYTPQSGTPVKLEQAES